MKQMSHHPFPDGKNQAILIVDDEESIRLMLVRILSVIGFQKIFLAEDGEKALEIYLLENIDLVVSDVHMPNMNGDDLFWELKKINENLRMILCSGQANGTDVNHLLQAGLSGFLRKPFSVDQLSIALISATS